MKVSEMGEFGLIDLLAKMVGAAQDKKSPAWQNLILGIGDDAAAWQGGTLVQLATVDSMIQDVDFTLDIVSWEELGWKALAVNLSDIAAMGGLPRYALVSLALPGDTEVESVTSLYKGMIGLARRFDIALVGGDMSSAPIIVINITVIGSTGDEVKTILTRSAARPGDKVAVTGYLGAAAAGLEMLTKHLSLDSDSAESLKKAFFKPYPRIAEGQELVECGVKAAIDISDGLIADLCHICKMSKVGARIEVDRMPVHPAVRASFGDRALELALSGGEDFELLFTASAGIINKVKKTVSCPITVIGEITADKTGEIIMINAKGNPFKLPKAGWEHFKNW
jgi:thiamine-monophosphate kinase